MVIRGFHNLSAIQDMHRLTSGCVFAHGGWSGGEGGHGRPVEQEAAASRGEVGLEGDVQLVAGRVERIRQIHPTVHVHQWRVIRTAVIKLRKKSTQVSIKQEGITGISVQ